MKPYRLKPRANGYHDKGKCDVCNIKRFQSRSLTNKKALDEECFKYDDPNFDGILDDILEVMKNLFETGHSPGMTFVTSGA